MCIGKPLHRQVRYSKNAVNAIGKFFGNRRRRCFITLKQSLPNGINAGAQRRNPPHAGDRQTHASSLPISTEAFVPPNPNEFESATSTTADRGSFAMMLRLTPLSGVVKLMLAGRNWC